MVMEVAEKIEVGAIFRRGHVKPVWFIWKSRRHSVKDVTYEWHEKRGENFFHFFQLVAEEGIYKVSLDSRSLAWNLEKVYDDVA